MKNNESGEYELVMGNRQLLSGFFIVALLFGVAFAMGYIVGRNSSPSAKAQAEAAGQPAPVADQRPTASGAVVPQPAPAEPVKTETLAADPAPSGVVQPASAQAAPSEKAPEIPAAAAVISEPAPGSYWQVIAVRQPEAEIVQRTLRDKGFPATLSPGPNNLVRVLVGPYGTRESLGKAKADLENAGFHPLLKK